MLGNEDDDRFELGGNAADSDSVDGGAGTDIASYYFGNDTTGGMNFSATLAGRSRKTGGRCTRATVGMVRITPGALARSRPAPFASACRTSPFDPLPRAATPVRSWPAYSARNALRIAIL